MNVPFVDLKEQYNEIKDDVLKGVATVFGHGGYILGPEAKQFEAEFAQYCGCEYAVGVNSGTDALYISCSALGIDEGDEVILPTHTFVATALCISYTGATPVFVDSEETTYNIDPKALEKAITPKTKAVIPVHIYGQPANMDEINAIAQKHGIKVIEDACQAHGALYKGKKAGSLGDIGCFSFYPTKNLGAFGDAGMLVTNDKAVFEAAQALRDYGRVGRYEHKVKGYNSRLDTVQGAVLSVKLKNLDRWSKMRQDVAAHYEQCLKDVEGVITPAIGAQRTHVFHLYVVRVKNRDKVMEALKEKGIGVLIHYPIPIHLQDAYQDLGGKKGDFPVAEQVADEIISLPMFPHMSQEQIEYVCEALKAAVK